MTRHHNGQMPRQHDSWSPEHPMLEVLEVARTPLLLIRCPRIAKWDPTTTVPVRLSPANRALHTVVHVVQVAADW